ncbi:fibroblast growth factor 1 isoform X3 [Clupea harengus]|uniref:Fibroblast growth factor n=1 Tax=Clupea harengus TaxID=7950 RepID=A0A6P3W9U0_CLUHA|nr:fibroblast growth factor 1 isoform X3 [Clupea harengus]
MLAHHTLLPQRHLPGTGRPAALYRMAEGEIALLHLGPETFEPNHPDHTALKRLYCKNGGHHLRLQTDGTVDGSRNENDLNTVLRVQAVSLGVVVITGKETELYLAMDQNGRLYGSASLNDECYFLEHMEENHYNTYRSNKYRDGQWYVGLKKDGRSKVGPQTSIGQKGVLFLPRPIGGS